VQLKFPERPSGQGAEETKQPPLEGFTEALHHHAARMERQYACAATGGVCESCGQRQSSFAAQLHWSAIYHSGATLLGSIVGACAAIGIGHGMTFYETVDFSTYHSFCRSCAHKIRFKKLLGQVLEKTCFAVLLLGLIAFILGFAILPFVVTHHPHRREVLAFGTELGGGLALILLGWFGGPFFRSWCLAKPLRAIGLRPFFLKSVEAL
jgi:hypothetical protein